jgi:hypothetical protein
LIAATSRWWLSARPPSRAIALPKEQAQREAIAAAFCASKDGPPTARFIWERLEHFLDHVERGRKKFRTEAALDAQRRQRESEKDEHA